MDAINDYRNSENHRKNADDGKIVEHRLAALSLYFDNHATHLVLVVNMAQPASGQIENQPQKKSNSHTIKLMVEKEC